MPDPSLCLHDGSGSVVGAEDTPLDNGFHYDGNASTNTKLGLWTDALSLVEIGLGGERGSVHNIKVDAGRAAISRFTANDAFVARLMADPVLAEYSKRPRCWPVYLVTGVMTAQDATVELSTGHSASFQAKVVVSGEGFGIPVKIGPEFERNASNAGGPTWKLAKPFVLAYEVQKIHRKMLGGLDSRLDNRHALWGERDAAPAEEWVVVPFIHNDE